MTNEYKRDLHADLALCEAATPGPWCFALISDDDNGSIVNLEGVCVMDFGTSPDIYGQTASVGSPPDDINMAFIEESREGWPEALRRAIEAERWLKALVSALDDGRLAKAKMSSGTDYVILCAREYVRKIGPQEAISGEEEVEKMRAALGQIAEYGGTDMRGTTCAGVAKEALDYVTR